QKENVDESTLLGQLKAGTLDVAGNADNFISLINPLLGATIMGERAWAAETARGLDEGAGFGEAAARGGVQAANEFVWELVAGKLGGILPGAGRNALKYKGGTRRVVESMLAEGLSEGVTEIMSSALDEAALKLGIGSDEL